MVLTDSSVYLSSIRGREPPTINRPGCSHPFNGPSASCSPIQGDPGHAVTHRRQEHSTQGARGLQLPCHSLGTLRTLERSLLHESERHGERQRPPLASTNHQTVSK